MTFMIYRTYHWDNLIPCCQNNMTQIQDTANGQRFGKGLMAFDTLLLLTLLVIGILGATSVIPIGSAASYALIGAGGACLFFSLSITAFFTKYDIHSLSDTKALPFFGHSCTRLRSGICPI